jgi:hypothetical protein
MDMRMAAMMAEVDESNSKCRTQTKIKERTLRIVGRKTFKWKGKTRYRIMSCKVTAVAWFNVALDAASDASPQEEYE